MDEVSQTSLKVVPHKYKYTVGQDPDHIEEVLAKNRRVAGAFLRGKCEKDAARNWDVFYKRHEDRFFKNKNWTDREFKDLGPEKDKNDALGTLDDTLLEEKMTSGQNIVLLEVGCGPGNTLYPIIQRSATTKAHCCDFSARAIELIQAHPLFDSQRINPFVFDLVKNEPDLASRLSIHHFGLPNVVSLIFVLSAIPPEHHQGVFMTLAKALPVGGALCFRDFAYGDLTQVRFHQKASASWCEPNLLSEDKDFYRRGDDTFTYFFNVEEVESLAECAGLQGKVEIKAMTNVNRKTGVQLHRRFIQGQWRKV